MESKTVPEFWEQYRDLPEQIQKRARKAYFLWKENRNHPSLRFHKVHPWKSYYSVSITMKYRAIGKMEKTEEGKIMWWIWIGDHQEYERLIDQF